MINLNTNLSSLIAQQSLSESTNKLNQAIERMSTGFKINHASDNAANYSISTNMTTKIGAYQVAEENAAMGLDLISTAEGTLTEIQDKLSRIRALQEQANNGTYGEKSLKAINSEVNALVDEIYRLYSTLEYNGISLSESLSVEDLGVGADTSVLPTIEKAVATYSLRATTEPIFVEKVSRRNTSSMTELSDVDIATEITSGTYSISTDIELAKLATMANNGLIHGGEFVLAADIDLSTYSTGTGWTPIGANHWSENHFEGIFDGNGYSISGLFINKPTADNAGVGLFGAVEGTIKNLSLVDVNLTGQKYVGGVVGCMMDDTIIENCSVTGTITGEKRVGGLVGGMYVPTADTSREIKNCYADVVISAKDTSGGILGAADDDISITNCITEGGLSFTNGGGGGIVGHLYHGSISNSVSHMEVVSANTGNAGVGGITGVAGVETVINNCYSDSFIEGTKNAGGIVGYACAESNGKTVRVSNSTFAGTISCALNSGGIIGQSSEGIGGAVIEGSTVTGTVNGTTNVGGLLGRDTAGNVTVSNCYVLGKSSGLTSVYIGSGKASSKVDNCYSSSYYKTLGISEVGGSVVLGKTSTYDSNAQPLIIGLQVGIDENDSSRINLEASSGLSGLRGLRNIGLINKDFTATIDKMLADLSAKQTHYGAVANRLESVLDEIAIQYDNLISSRSTIRDADISEISSNYIQQQILQQASATLLATANQSPSIALQLI